MVEKRGEKEWEKEERGMEALEKAAWTWCTEKKFGGEEEEEVKKAAIPSKGKKRSIVEEEPSVLDEEKEVKPGRKRTKKA